VTSERRYSDRTIYRRVLVEARPYWGHIGGVLLLYVVRRNENFRELIY
jgi:hypothetical protein